MEQKDDEIVRFSDLIKKGTVKKSSPDKEAEPEIEDKAEEGPLRLSELGALKLKSRLVSRRSEQSKEQTVLSEKEAVSEKVTTTPREDNQTDYREYRDVKSKELRKASPTAVSPSRDSLSVQREEKVRSSRMEVTAGKVQVENTEKRDAGVIVPPDRAIKESEESEVEVSVQPVVDVRKIYDDARFCLETIKGRIIAGQRFDIQPARKIIERMAESRDLIEAIYPLTTKTFEEEDYNISHQVNVAVYSLKLGLGLGYTGGKILDLGLCALLHDAGMFRIPDAIRLKRDKLTGQEIDIIKTHPDIGRDILNAYRESHPNLPIVAYEHHEREGGQGYPRGLQGNSIHEFARVVAIADSYEAMTHHRPYRRALLQPLSAKELIKQKNELFAPFVIKVFLQEISLYPPGSYVILNNKAIARVMTNDRQHPLRPDVKIIYDGEGNRVEGDVIVKLAQNPLFFIVDGVSQDEIPGEK